MAPSARTCLARPGLDRRPWAPDRRRHPLERLGGRAGWQTTDDAYLQSDLTPIAAKVPGYVRAVPVQDFERVRAGQLVAQIVDDDYRAAVAQAAANVAAATAQIADAEGAARRCRRPMSRRRRRSIASTAATLDAERPRPGPPAQAAGTGSSSTEATEKLQTTRDQLAAQLAQNRAQADAAARQIDVLAAQAGPGGGGRGGPAGQSGDRPDQSRLHPHRRARGRRPRSAAGAARPVRRRRRPDHHPDAAAAASG